MDNKYIRLIDDGFGFVVDGIHKIMEQDKPISEENYNKFFEEQSLGKQFKIKDVNANSFEEIFEEIAIEVDNSPKPPTEEERISALEEAMLMLL